jgi:putative hemin transport protein
MPDSLTPDDLLEREAALRTGGADLRMRDAAAALDVPEAALLEARRATGAAERLRRAEVAEGFGTILARLPEAGEVMALTRNEACVHEKHGRFAAPDFQGAMGQVVGDIDLRLFLRHWAFGYALSEETRSGPRRNLQFFDASGTAIHKVYATAATDRAAFERVAADFADPETPPARFAPPPEPAPDRPDAEVDAAGLVAAWEQLQHTHEFFQLLRRFGATRGQAMRLAPSLARPVAPEAARSVLTRVAAEALPIMVFVGNVGCVQIHSGPVRRIEVMGPWLNVLDPAFNLHLREDRIAGAYVVRKPSVNGEIHALELYDAGGDCFCQVFGQRHAGGTERPDWRALVTGLPDLP